MKTILSCAVALASSSSFAQGASIFQGADLALGTRLIVENKCVECHSQKTNGQPSSIYRPLGRVNSPGLLRGMVEQCNSQLNFGMFPEEVNAVAAVLNRDHYKFK